MNMESISQAVITGTLMNEVPEIINCDFENEAVKGDHFGYIVANVKHSHLRKIVITEKFVYHLILVTRLPEVHIALYEVYLNV